jgi:hypothetical protein
MPPAPLLLRGESSHGGAYALHFASEGRVRLHASFVVRFGVSFFHSVFIFSICRMESWRPRCIFEFARMGAERKWRTRK